MAIKEVADANRSRANAVWYIALLVTPIIVVVTYIVLRLAVFG